MVLRVFDLSEYCRDHSDREDTDARVNKDL